MKFTMYFWKKYLLSVIYIAFNHHKYRDNARKYGKFRSTRYSTGAILAKSRGPQPGFRGARVVSVLYATKLYGEYPSTGRPWCTVLI